MLKVNRSPGTLVSSANNTDCHNIAEKLLKVALNTIHPHSIHLDGRWYTGKHY